MRDAEDFAREQNIQRFRQSLAKATDERERELLRRLLDEELKKRRLAKPDH